MADQFLNKDGVQTLWSAVKTRVEKVENEFVDGTKKVKSAETADKANSVAWVDVTDKPTNFITSDNIGSQTVSKANQDGSGNVITSTYATKWELDGKAGKYDVDQPWHDIYHADPIGWTKIADLGGSNSCGVVEILAISDWNYATLYHGYFSFSCYGRKGSYKYSLVSDPKAFGFQEGYTSEDSFGVKVTVDKDGGVWIGLMKVLYSCVPKFRYIIFPVPATSYESDFTTSDTAPMPDNCIILDNGALEVTNGVPNGNGLIPNYMRNINLIDGKNNGKDIATKDDIPAVARGNFSATIGMKANDSVDTSITFPSTGNWDVVATSDKGAVVMSVISLTTSGCTIRGTRWRNDHLLGNSETINVHWIAIKY